MEQKGIKSPAANLDSINVSDKVKTAYWNLSPAELYEATVKDDLGVINDTGALVVDTGKFTGRSPNDRFIVKDDLTANSVDWNDINLPFEAENFDALLADMGEYVTGKEVYVRDAYACADDDYRLNIRVVTEMPWANMFANNMFLRPSKEEVQSMEPDWTIFAVPSFHAESAKHGTRQHNFSVINFTKKMIIIGGTAYTGEIKKGIFSVLNFILPHDRDVLSMHCSANIGKDGDTALFFGLSGTGKTTLSADPERGLIGDDEHGWSDTGVFNFEGGCYAKCIDLTEEKEPEIFNAIKFGALLENIRFYEGTRTVDFKDKSVTENTRVSYPIDHIANAVSPSKGGIPKNIFFLTADAFGVLPPISKLTPGQAMFHFISGYTAKVAGTEAGIDEPKTTFSACFGSPFLPLHPTQYATMLGERMEKHGAKVWLVNTGWTGGPYGVGSRMKLKYTRAMITAALNGELDNVEYKEHVVFGLAMPQNCPDVPSEVLDPKNTWKDGDAYDKKADHLANAFNENFKAYEVQANEETLNGAPKPLVKV